MIKQAPAILGSAMLVLVLSLPLGGFIFLWSQSERFKSKPAPELFSAIPEPSPPPETPADTPPEQPEGADIPAVVQPEPIELRSPLEKKKCLPLIRDSLAAIERVNWLRLDDRQVANYQQARGDLLYAAASLLVHRSEAFKESMARQLSKMGQPEAVAAHRKLLGRSRLLLIPHAGDFRNLATGEIAALTGPTQILEVNAASAGPGELRIRLHYERHFYDWRVRASLDSGMKPGGFWRETEVERVPLLFALTDSVEGQAGEAVAIEPLHLLHRELARLSKNEICFFSLGVFQTDRTPMIFTINSYEPSPELHRQQMWFKGDAIDRQN